MLGTEAVARGLSRAHVSPLNRLSMLIMVAYTNTVNAASTCRLLGFEAVARGLDHISMEGTCD